MVNERRIERCHMCPRHSCFTGVEQVHTANFFPNIHNGQHCRTQHRTEININKLLAKTLKEEYTGQCIAHTSEFVIEVTLPEEVKQGIYNYSVVVPQKKRQAQNHTSIARYPAQAPSSGSELAAMKYHALDIQATST